MLQKNQTKLEVFGFSDQPEDLFYCLLDLTNRKAGIDLDRLSSTKPEKLDEILQEMGCLVLLSKKDVDKVLNGADDDHDKIHEKLYQWALEEDMV